MPMTEWKHIVGKKCVQCEKPASHFWGVYPVCCQCHGGDMFTAEETAFVHEFYEKHGRHPEDYEYPAGLRPWDHHEGG